MACSVGCVGALCLAFTMRRMSAMRSGQQLIAACVAWRPCSERCSWAPYATHGGDAVSAAAATMAECPMCGTVSTSSRV
eukprot:356346-Chlamydomonas_euryale.AAC.3